MKSNHPCDTDRDTDCDTDIPVCSVHEKQTFLSEKQTGMSVSRCLLAVLFMLGSVTAQAQVNSGSNGSDGAFNPQSSVTIDMANHPDGIYQYTSVNIPSGVTVSFTSNAKNTPVVWLVQGDCVISGAVDVSGKDSSPSSTTPGTGGPGGFGGGNGGMFPSAGGGPGGGAPGATDGGPLGIGGNGSYSRSGQALSNQQVAGTLYGNKLILPLIGGSGGGGFGGGGGGAVLFAVSGRMTVTGTITTNGGSIVNGGGGGSGGAVRIVAAHIDGFGSVTADGGFSYRSWWTGWGYASSASQGGAGWVRIDSIDNQFSGSFGGATFSNGFQPIILPAAGQGVQLAVQSIGGISIAGSPSGVLANPDLIIPAQQSNPLNVVVGCTNLPLNTAITLIVHPATGPDVTATGTNSTGTQASSSATIPINMPRGGGIIYARCVSGLAGVSATGTGSDVKNIAQTGWTTDGETFAQMEITAGLSGSPRISYITSSGKKYALPMN